MVKLQNKAEGYILPTTLMALTVMLTVILTLAVLAQAELKSSRYTADLIQAKYTAISLMEFAKAKLTPIRETYFHYRMLDPAWSENGLERDDVLKVTLNPEALDLGEARVEVDVEDECGKLDLNYLTRRQMTVLTGLGVEVVDPVIDWRDSDSVPQEYGAESDDYLARGMDYPAKDRPFDTLDELMLVKGFSKSMLDMAVNESMLRDVLTVWSKSPNLAPDGKSKINLNTVTVTQLQERLGGSLTQNEAQLLVTYVKAHKFTGLGELFDVSGLTRKKVATVIDYLTVYSGTVTGGRVNINTASYPVLKAVIEDETAAITVWQARNKAVFYRSLGELVGDETLSTDILTKLVNNCSVGTYRFRVLVRATYGRARVRLLAVVDLSSGIPKVIYTAFQNPL